MELNRAITVTKLTAGDGVNQSKRSDMYIKQPAKTMLLVI